MKHVKSYQTLSRHTSLTSSYCLTFHGYRSLIIPSHFRNEPQITPNIQYPLSISSTIKPRLFCTNSSSSSNDGKAREDELKHSFMSKYQSKIRKATSPEAIKRLHEAMSPRQHTPKLDPTITTSPEEVLYSGFSTVYETPKEKSYNPRTVFGIHRSTFRGLIITMACLIGATCFVILRPSPITEENERRNMHFFARLNADPSIHVTYSGLMYKIVEQHELNEEETELHLLTSPNLDIDSVNIDYEGRFVDGTVFDSTFNEEADGCIYPAKSLIVGLHQGISNMTRESIFEFYIPPHLGYGERGSEFIPPHEPLVFRVRLNDFWKDQDLNRPRKFKIIT